MCYTIDPDSATLTSAELYAAVICGGPAPSWCFGVRGRAMREMRFQPSTLPQALPEYKEGEKMRNIIEENW